MNLRAVWVENTVRRQWQQKKWRGKIYKVFKRQIEAAAEAYAARSTGIFFQVDEVIRPLAIGEVIYRLSLDVGVREANNAYREVQQQVSKRASLGFDEEFAKAIIDYLEKYFLITVNNINEYTKELILEVIAKGVAEGKGQDEIVRGILELKVISGRRANTIVRTEVNRASNIGRVIGAKKTGLLLKKIWSSANQQRTRGSKPKDKADHLHMNAQKVDMDEKFIDPRNGAKLDQPGDPNAPIENTVNCRCAVAFEPQKDAMGNYIRIEKPLYESVFN